MKTLAPCSGRVVALGRLAAAAFPLTPAPSTSFDNPSINSGQDRTGQALSHQGRGGTSSPSANRSNVHHALPGVPDSGPSPERSADGHFGPVCARPGTTVVICRASTRDVVQQGNMAPLTRGGGGLFRLLTGSLQPNCNCSTRQGKRIWVQIACSSLPRRRESRFFRGAWIPAFAGMTLWELGCRHMRLPCSTRRASCVRVGQSA